jgi:hypothetical protein
MVSLSTLTAEIAFLNAAVKTHRERIERADSAADAAEEAFTEVFGYHPSATPELAPGWAHARAKAEALREETGFFWACSRLTDLEILVGREGETLAFITAPSSDWATARSWVLRGETPKAHESVGPWVLGVFGMAKDGWVEAYATQFAA